MVVVVYNDDAYGAEVHHFGPDGLRRSTRCSSPTTDLAAIARGYGFTGGHRPRRRATSTAWRGWLAGPRDRPLLVDAKVTRDEPSWWLEEAFRGH